MLTRTLCSLFFSWMLLGCRLLLPAQITALETHYEKSGFRETPRHDKTIRYCKQLSQASSWIHYTSIGTSPQGREIPLLIVDKQGRFDPAAVHQSRNAVVLIQACIHPGEPDGKDAGLMLVRDMAVTRQLESLLDNVTILFLPILNVDGHERFGPFNRINQNGPAEMGWRTNAQNLNLNRDYVKAESPEIRFWLQLFNEWLPDFFIDCHVTNGADYQYVVTYSMETGGNMDQGLTSWQSGEFLPALESRMLASGYPVIPYVAFRDWHDPRSGLQTWASPAMFSTGYLAVQNRPGLLIETHMLKDYKTRVSATYEMLKHSIELVNADYRKLTDLVRKADEICMADLSGKSFVVRYDLSETDSTMIDFLGFDYTVEKSELSGGDWFRYTDQPAVMQIPLFNKLKPASSVILPEAYLIPPEWTEATRILRQHGIRTFTLRQESRIKSATCRFKDVQFRNTPFEGRMTVTFQCDTLTEECTYPAGTVVVETRQRAARLIAALLEPGSPSSLVYWGYFNAVFEQKEYAESYVMEKLAREMAARDPALLAEFQKKKETDAGFAKSPRNILNWFYARSPWWDDRKDIYPVGKLYDRKIVDKLKQ